MSDLARRVEQYGSAGLSPTGAAVLRIIENGARRMAPIGETARLRQIERLTEADAWAEAALALVELELPDWRVRRLERDGEEWFCTISKHSRMPREFDDAVDGHATLLPLAILDALAEAKRRQPDPQPRKSPSLASSERPETAEIVWCENCF